MSEKRKTKLDPEQIMEILFPSEYRRRANTVDVGDIEALVFLLCREINNLITEKTEDKEQGE